VVTGTHSTSVSALADDTGPLRTATPWAGCCVLPVCVLWAAAAEAVAERRRKAEAMVVRCTTDLR
jgi:high-affinity K+ transport system ATPase subunit B